MNRSHRQLLAASPPLPRRRRPDLYSFFAVPGALFILTCQLDLMSKFCKSARVLCIPNSLMTERPRQ